MPNYKAVRGAAAVLIGLIAYIPYLRDVFKGRTKPHAFSWLAWGTMEVIAFFAQFAKGGGAGTWATGTSAAATLLIAALAFRNKDKEIKLFDWLAFAGAITGIVLWRTLGNPVAAVIAVTLADALAFTPTFRKAFHKPYEETLSEYSLSAVKWLFAIAALEAYSATTWLYPASLVLTNTIFITVVYSRRLKNAA
jgi:hypothetical protein